MGSVTASNRSGFNWRLIAIVALFFGFLAAYLWNHPVGVDLPYGQMVEVLQSGRIVTDETHPLDLQIEEGRSTLTLIGYYHPAPSNEGIQRFHTAVSQDVAGDLAAKLKSAGLSANMHTSSAMSTSWLGPLPSLFVVLIPFAVIWALLRRMSARGRRPDPTAPR